MIPCIIQTQKQKKNIFNIVLFYLGINDQQIFYQNGEGTSQTNDESGRGTTTTTYDELAPANASQEQNQSQATNEDAKSIEIT